ncbi:hypothetical protein BUALT_Bualt16G0084100 [Buddleja alternifolia]|uniref:J domain-containing protein n=1 Tax=Buddleja alternifolia TaxID=168488 RepID=A0AAV6W7Y4_9LAMI|nr:hypothetical protein BUALT_Bualt16G0084100 [Buddleja alternifolia]
MEVIDVYAFYDKNINKEANYYGILAVLGPFPGEEVMKKQYKKMASAFYPDKNKSAGVDGAFKLLSQVWSILSNKDMSLYFAFYTLLLRSRMESNDMGMCCVKSAMCCQCHCIGIDAVDR